MKRKRNSKAQVWIETVLYTLIGLGLIAVLLAVAKPRIDSYRDRIVVEQTIQSMTLIDEKINDVLIAPGNKRIVSLKISNGKMSINTSAETINWVLDSKNEYSEPKKEVRMGNIKILTLGGGTWKVYLTMNYSGKINLNSSEEVKEIQASATAYSLAIENNGLDSDNKPVVKILDIK